MTLNPHQQWMLRKIAEAPRRAKDFSRGADGLNPSILLMYLNKMVDAGLVELDNSAFTITDAGIRAVAALDSTVPPRTLCNAASTGIYRPTWAPIRPGADDHKRHASLTPFRG